MSVFGIQFENGWCGITVTEVWLDVMSEYFYYCVDKRKIVCEFCDPQFPNIIYEWIDRIFMPKQNLVNIKTECCSTAWCLDEEQDPDKIIGDFAYIIKQHPLLGNILPPMSDWPYGKSKDVILGWINGFTYSKPEL